MARRMIAKFEKYWSDIPSVMAVAAVLDPMYKMLRVDFHFGNLYGFDASQYESKVLTGSTLVEQVEDSLSYDHSIKVLAGDEEYEEYNSQAISRMNKSELETYLVEQVEDNLPNFNILSW
ncbi:hypothetical protein ACOSQ4_017275 [Xanthoceras sorbifolium]